MTGRKLIWAAAVASALTGCQGAQNPFANMQNPFSTRGSTAAEEEGSVRMVERDVEAPEVFQRNEAGTWDGRPSLGAVWIAHEDAGEPLRTIIRRADSDAFVVGMLYKRSATNPGEGFQVSADAAEALGLQPGEEAWLDVTALVPETVPEDMPELGASPLDAAAPIEEVQLTSAPLGAEPLLMETLEDAMLAPEPEILPDPLDVAAAAIPAAPAPMPAAAPSAGGLERAYVQIGIFSAEANAERAAGELRARGAAAELRRIERDDDAEFWRVLAGPAATEADRDAIVIKAREAGFEDAYPAKG